MIHDVVLTAIVEAAMNATGATHGWVLRSVDDTLEVAAAVGPGAASLVGVTIDVQAGTAGYVAASGQPLALSGAANDPRLSTGVVAHLGHRPASVLCVPCASGDAVVGVLELIDKHGGDRFTFDDVELATLLGGIAAPALSDASSPSQVASPDELGAELGRLADTDPARYATVAGVVETLLARG